MATCLLYLSTFLLAITTASALKCYACTGFACNYPLLSFTYPEVQCEAKTGNSLLDKITSAIPTQCVKVIGKDENGSSFVARNCTTYTTQVGCNLITSAMELGSKVNDVECFTCTSDYCNSASKFSGMAAIGILIACFMFLF